MNFFGQRGQERRKLRHQTGIGDAGDLTPVTAELTGSARSRLNTRTDSVLVCPQIILDDAAEERANMAVVCFYFANPGSFLFEKVDKYKFVQNFRKSDKNSVT